MTRAYWRFIELVAHLLEPNERESVLGDLLESSEGVWRSSFDVVGLVLRRQTMHWRSWRPWLAVFGLALPGSLLLMGLSVSFSVICEGLVDARIAIGAPQSIRDAFSQLLCRGVLLIVGSWSSGFVLGSISRKTMWVSIASSCFPCLFCFVRFREPSLSKLCLFLFLVPATWGVRQALRGMRINLPFSFFLAIAITALTMLPTNSRGVWALNWSLIWPAWYMLARCHGGEPDTVEGQ